MTRGWAMAVTAVAFVYQCAEMHSTARGAGTQPPNVRQASVKRLCSSVFIGLPCPTNPAGILVCSLTNPSVLVWSWVHPRAASTSQIAAPHRGSSMAREHRSRSHARAREPRALELPTNLQQLPVNRPRVVATNTYMFDGQSWSSVASGGDAVTARSRGDVESGIRGGNEGITTGSVIWQSGNADGHGQRAGWSGAAKWCSTSRQSLSA